MHIPSFQTTAVAPNGPEIVPIGTTRDKLPACSLSIERLFPQARRKTLKVAPNLGSASLSGYTELGLLLVASLGKILSLSTVPMLGRSVTARMQICWFEALRCNSNHRYGTCPAIPCNGFELSAPGFGPSPASPGPRSYNLVSKSPRIPGRLQRVVSPQHDG